MKRKCPRALDRPILMFGLEMEDLGLLGLVGGIGSIFFGPLVPGACSILLWVVLAHFKKDKPSGYLLHWLYGQGIELPGLAMPVKKVQHYGAYARACSIKKI